MNGQTTRKPKHEHSVPWFWPLAAAIEMEEAGLDLFRENLRFLSEAARIEAPPPPDWATPNRVLLDMDTMRLRDFSPSDSDRSGLPVLIDAPYAGHSSTIADFAKGQSLVATVMSAGLKRVLVTDWKGATAEMGDFDIDKYLAEINAAVDTLGGRAHLVGLCQGGWMSAMFAARFPDKVQSLVLAGAPIDTDAGHGPIRKIAHELPMSFYEEMVAAGGGRMLGQFMLAGWKDMHPGEQYVGKFIDLYEHIEDLCRIKRTEKFESWYENPIDLPGRYYLQAIRLLFKENRFATDRFVALGRPISLNAITCPLYLLAGENDDITTKEQVFAAKKLVSTPGDKVVSKLIPGGHIGLFMGSHALRDAWPEIAHWIAREGSLPD